MIFILNTILITSMLVIGATIVTQKGMGLYFIREWADKKKGWTEPIIRCHWCMPSLWTVFGYLYVILVGGDVFSFKMLYLYPVCVAGSSFLCGMSWALYKLVSAAISYCESAEQLANFEIEKREIEDIGKS